MIREYRKISAWDLRSLCIKYNWYNNGTNQEYEKLLEKVRDKKHITTKMLEDIALDINKHTSSDNEFKDEIECICYEIELISYHTFENK